MDNGRPVDDGIPLDLTFRVVVHVFDVSNTHVTNLHWLPVYGEVVCHVPGHIGESPKEPEKHSIVVFEAIRFASGFELRFQHWPIIALRTGRRTRAADSDGVHNADIFTEEFLNL